MTFRAKYDGHCHECKTTFEKDDLIEMVDGVPVHAECDLVPVEAPRPTCPECWEVQAVNGACGCDPE